MVTSVAGTVPSNFRMWCEDHTNSLCSHLSLYEERKIGSTLSSPSENHLPYKAVLRRQYHLPTIGKHICWAAQLNFLYVTSHQGNFSSNYVREPALSQAPWNPSHVSLASHPVAVTSQL